MITIDERQRERRLWQRHAERCVEQLELPQHDEQRQDRHGDREEQAEGEEAVDEPRARETSSGR